MRTLIATLLILSGCVTMTPEEIEWSRAMAKVNWETCAAMYSNAGVPTVHYQHEHGERDRVRIGDIRSDLLVNHCRMIVGKYWAE